MRKETLQWLVPVLLAIVLAAILWFYWSRTGRQEEAPAHEPETIPTEAVDEGPLDLPERPLQDRDEPLAEQRDLQPLPPLEESDDYFRRELSDLFGEPLNERLADNNLIERTVATVDNLSRDQIADRIKPMSGAPGQFMVNEGGEEDEFVLDPQNFERYDSLVELLANADDDGMAELYRRFYPLFQEAYVHLGYPEDYFNDRVIEVIDHLLATPEINEPVKLKRPHVLYEYADPELEELSPGQKLLLRMGSKHASTIKTKLREFRGRISAGGQTPD
jgi:hypothetical protein